LFGSIATHDSQEWFEALGRVSDAFVTDVVATTAVDRMPCKECMLRKQIENKFAFLLRAQISSDLSRLCLAGKPVPALRTSKLRPFRLSGVCRSLQAEALRRPFPSPGMASAASDQDPGFCRVFNAAEVAKHFRAELLAATAASTSLRGRKPKLVGFLASDSAPSIAYAEWTRKACEEVGIEYELRTIGAAQPQVSLDEPGQLEGISASGGLGEIEEKLLEANEDPDVNGIMVSCLRFSN
jgi:hypothetical protein